MKGRTHAAFALSIGLFSATFFASHLPQQLLFIASVFLSSLLPDIDDPRSTLGKRTKVFSWPFRILLGHRGVFHSLIMPAFLSLLAYYLGSPAIAFGILIGYCSHLLLDALTHAGIRPFYPLPLRLKGAVRTGGIVDIALFILSLAGIAVFIIRNI
jgi:inner membrane protein